MKVVRGTGGGYVMAIRLEFLLGRHDLVDALAWNHRDEPHDTEGNAGLVDLTQVQARELVTEALRQTGARGYSWWSDGVSEEWSERVRAWAERQVRRCFRTAFIRAGDTDGWGDPLLEVLAGQ